VIFCHHFFTRVSAWIYNKIALKLVAFVFVLCKVDSHDTFSWQIHYAALIQYNLTLFVMLSSQTFPRAWFQILKPKRTQMRELNSHSLSFRIMLFSVLLVLKRTLISSYRFQFQLISQIQEFLFALSNINEINLDSNLRSYHFIEITFNVI
jgi:hypothetical protein